MQLNMFFHSTVYRLADQIAYAEGSVVSKIVSKKETGNITLFSFDQGQGLSEHTAPFDAFIQVLDGSATVTIAGKNYVLNANDAINMPAGVPHSVFATEKFKMLLTMIRSK